MRTLQLRRHAPRVPGTIYLSHSGVALARRIGQTMGPFARVITSPAMWVHETAVAMGFAVDEHYLPVDLTDGEWHRIGQLIPPEASFADRSAAMQDDPLAARLGAALRQQWLAYALALPEGASGLVVTHGGYLDNSVVACLWSADHAAWGEPFGHCEGMRLTFGASEFVSGEILRVDD